MMNEPQQYLDDFLKTHEIPGELLFACVGGSYAHNCYLVDSDIDILGIYVQPTRAILSLKPPAENWMSDKPDAQFYEVGKWAKLLAKGNPTIVQMLFTEHFTVVRDPLWLNLYNERQRFLSRRVIYQHLGYMNAQQKRYNGTGLRDSKSYFHTIRLGLNALEIAEGHTPRIYMTGQDRDFLLQVREGFIQEDLLKYTVSELISKIESINLDRIPPEADLNYLNEWLWQVRQENL